MRRIIALALFAMGIAFGCFHAARATSTVQVLETWPTGNPVTLQRNRTFYLHLRYTSDKPVQIWAQPYFRGSSVRAGSNPSQQYPAGSGEALGWFFLYDADGKVDEVRISAGDGTPAGTQRVTSYAVQVDGDARTAPASAPQPEWVTRLDAQQQAALRADYRKRMDAPVSPGEGILFSGFLLLMLAIGVLGLGGPLWGLWRWRGGWRWAAAVPAAVMAFVVLRILFDTARDPTSHNLWPLEILMWGFASAASIGLMMLLRRASGAATKR